MSGIIVFGAGGHGEVVVDAVMASGLSVISVIDDDKDKWDTIILGVTQVLSISIENYKPQNQGCAVMGIGCNRTRERLVALLSDRVLLWASIIHPEAYVRDVIQGEGTVVLPGAIVQVGAQIGSHCIINTGATVDHHCVVEDFVHIAPGAHLAGNVHIGEGAMVGIGAVVLPGASVPPWYLVSAGTLFRGG